jgi:phosphate transport system protein
MNNHIMQAYDEDLKEISKKIMMMGQLSIDAIEQSLVALMDSNVELASKIREQDKFIDALQHDIEEKCTITIAKRQPMANDLRAIMSAIRVANDLERIGDLAKNIAKRVIKIKHEGAKSTVPLGFNLMGSMVCDRIDKVLVAYRENDLELALDVWQHDDEVDLCYNSLFRELLTYMVEKPKSITSCAHLLFCAKNLERAGDHATNIAEIIWYKEKGEVLANVRPTA